MPRALWESRGSFFLKFALCLEDLRIRGAAEKMDGIDSVSLLSYKSGSCHCPVFLWVELVLEGGSM